MKVIKPPTEVVLSNTLQEFSIFLAGSIEMGAAEDWQQCVIDELAGRENLTILSPRRDDWDSSWEQTIDNPPFVGQVEWELDGLDSVDYILMYFDPNTKSPISLLELGLYATTGRLRVVCPEGFWRKGNVDIVCRRYSIPLYTSLDKCVEDIKTIHLRNTPW